MINIDPFLQSIVKHIFSDSLIKISFINKRNKKNELQKVSVKPVLIKGQLMLSFVYRNKTNDLTKNYIPGAAQPIIRQLLTEDFYQAILFTSLEDIHLTVHPKGTTKTKVAKPTLKLPETKTHDHQKFRIIDSNSIYFKELGISNQNGQVIKDKQAKYKQINRFIEILDNLVEVLPEKPSLIDMGSGKGYLSFALYDYLSQKFPGLSMTGIELRDELVEKCNKIAQKAEFENLKFYKSSIEKYPLKEVDALIALHACDTATDDAIAKGIKANAKLIICSPCCHKQVRKSLIGVDKIQSIYKYGILQERQAEILTDTIRALMLEAHGYKTNVMEYISNEHTSKNLLITAVKKTTINGNQKAKLKEVKDLKKLFGIKEHYLERLL